MINFQQKRKKFFYSKPFLFIMFIFLVFLSVGVVKLYQKMSDNRENRKNIEYKVLELENRKESLIYNIENLNTEKGKEKIFRENLGLAKEGEGLIMIIEEENNEKKEEIPRKSFFSFFKKIFSRNK